ncbi:F-box domain-containing protein [Mycena sanguinolenta]|uniref:F-box domain-containing protein n=1 Tax=Mycena sanguinolenta TaxID=230812 RepID=A0A8H7DN41_9AGAR|nr:F-box domain-containing protein [Mycena sanguinolenta]
MQLFEFHDPSIRDRLRGNIPPSDTDKSEIQLSIYLAKSHLAESEARHATRYTDVALRTYIRDYSSLLGPIRRIPTEVLQLIFVHPDLHDREWIGPLMMTIYRPETIGMVCHHWREVVRSTPLLWTSLRISLRYGQCSDLRQLRMRLELSKNYPLSISFNSVYSYEEDEVPELRKHVLAVEKITAEIVHHAERWAQLKVPLNYDFLALLSSARGRLLRLEKLGFGDSGSIDTPNNSMLSQIKIFEDAPKLRSLSVKGRAVIMNLPTLPWNQLTRITAPHHSSLATEKILQLSSNLRDVVLYLDRGFMPRPSHPRRGPGIRTVVLNGMDSAMVFGLTDALASMETPGLKEIHLMRCSWSPLGSIPSLVRRSSCSLETLVLDRTRVRPGELLALFPTIPTIGTLVLVHNYPNTVTNILLEGLTPSLSDVNVCVLPALHTLVLKGAYLCSTDKLVTLLESRMRSQHPIVNLDIALHDRDLDATDLERCAVLLGAVATYLPRVLSVYAGKPGWNPEDSRYFLETI